jgi:hypothetical protein
MRIVVGLHENSSAETVAAALVDAGAISVRSTAPAQPRVLVAEFPAAEAPAERAAQTADQSELIERVSKLPGVRYAEPDEMQTAF